MLPREVLFDACEEGLGEKEARDPKDIWLAILNPLLEDGQAFLKIFNITKERLPAWVGFF